MSQLRCHISISLDGYVAGPNQSEENPLGEGGEALHEWAFGLKAFREPHDMDGGTDNASTPIVQEELANVGAEIMGRGKFGPPGGGPWAHAPAIVRRALGPPQHHHELALDDVTRRSEPVSLVEPSRTFVVRVHGERDVARHRSRSKMRDKCIKRRGTEAPTLMPVVDDDPTEVVSPVRVVIGPLGEPHHLAVSRRQPHRVPDLLVGRPRDVPRHRVHVPQLLRRRGDRKDILHVVRRQLDDGEDLAGHDVQCRPARTDLSALPQVRQSPGRARRALRARS